MFFGRPEIGIKENEQAIKYDPNFKFAYRIKGLAYGSIGKHRIAANAYKQGLKFHYDIPLQYNTLYNDWVGEKYYYTPPDSLVLYCDTAISLNPKNVNAYYTRGKVYLKGIKNIDLATTDFNKVIELDTSRNSVSYIFAQYYMGKTDLALELVKSKIFKSKTDKDLSLAYYNISCLYSLMNDKKQALNYLQLALEKGYNKGYAFADDDFNNVRNTEEFTKLVSN